MRVFVISDTHFPFHNKKAYNRMLKACKKYKPHAVVQIGDLLDQYVFSRYSKKTHVTTAKDVTAGLVQADNMWRAIRKSCPRAKCYQVLGNHDMRLSKRIAEKLPELADIFGIANIYRFHNVKVLASDRDYFKFDGVIYCHGWLSRSIDHAKHFNKPTVHGHRHHPGVDTDGPLWSMDVGYMADKSTLPMSYTASKYSRWRMAYGTVTDGQPHLTFLE